MFDDNYVPLILQITIELGIIFFHLLFDFYEAGVLSYSNSTFKKIVKQRLRFFSIFNSTYNRKLII
jgi:hypothetical protein